MKFNGGDPLFLVNPIYGRLSIFTYVLMTEFTHVSFSYLKLQPGICDALDWRVISDPFGGEIVGGGLVLWSATSLFESTKITITDAWLQLLLTKIYVINI